MKILRLDFLKVAATVSVVGFAACKSNEQRDFSEEQNIDNNLVPSLHALERYEGGSKESEEKAINEVTQIAMDSFKNGDRKGLRDQHARATGCVRAQFSISNDIPTEFKEGIFGTAPMTYSSWVRYSPASADVHAPDGKGVYGFAIKLMGVEGRKILKGRENEGTQDFLLANFPSFLVSNIGEYAGLQKKHLIEVAKAMPKLSVMKGQKVSDLGEESFFSMSSYALGERTAVKYKVAPCRKANPQPPKEGLEDDFLTKRLESRLNNEELCYKFFGQQYIDDRKTPVENPKVEWKESKFVELATITIPRQQFTSKNQQEFCENLTFTPWHSLAEHRPLGSLNRARKAVYASVSERRHLDRNQPAQPPEPTANGPF